MDSLPSGASESINTSDSKELISGVEIDVQGEVQSSEKNHEDVYENIENTTEEEVDRRNTSGSNEDASDSKEKKQKNDGFLSPVSIPLIARASKKADGRQSAKQVTMSLKSKFAIPSDIYKTPKIAAFMAEMPSRTKNNNEQKQKDEQEQGISFEKTDPEKEKPKPKPPPPKLSYEAPEWGSVPEDEKYSMEVLKMGSIVDKVELSGKDSFTVGRLPDCDIKMEHPSISRYHAVLQYGAPGPNALNVELQKDSSFGFYICDLGSTHGTMINKQNIQPKTFYRIKVGHVVKFGGSTRLFILQGPAGDQEEEAKQTATELREYNKQKIKKKKDLEKMMLGEDSSSDEEDGERKKKSQKSMESSGVTWGMLEEAVQSSSDEEEEPEEEGDTRADHPDAVLVHTKKDPFYVKDPMKALKNLYEKEKMELDFECDERRSGHWHVRLCLPVDGPSGKPVYAEVNATGKKKDTMRQCALEACRILERHGMFHHKEQQRHKVKQWENDDFYDSDEDEFHDRTGELERKRKLRMLRVGKKSKTSKVVETYESLAKQVQYLDNEINDIESKLHKDKEATRVNPDAADPLDAFMQQVKSGKALDTTTRAKLKRRLFDARKEHMRISKLAELARPSSLPPLVSSSVKNYSFIGKMKGKKKPLTNNQTISTVEKFQITPQQQEAGDEEEEDEDVIKQDSAPKQTKFVKLMDIKQPVESTSKDRTKCGTSSENIELLSEGKENHRDNDEKKSNSLNVDENQEEILQQLPSTAANDHTPSKRILGPTLPAEFKERLSVMEEQTPEKETGDEEASEPRKKRRRQRKPRQPNEVSGQQYSNDPKYSVWLPPEDQSGDGKTSLNEKLGY